MFFNEVSPDFVKVQNILHISKTLISFSTFKWHVYHVHLYALFTACINVQTVVCGGSEEVCTVR